MNKTGIYQIVNKITDKRYVGSAVNIKQRWSAHKSQLRRGVHGNKHLQSSFNLYGESAFEFKVIINCAKDFLINCEQFYIDEMKPEYNKAPKAGSSLGIKRSVETRAKVGAASKGNKYRLNTVHSEETLIKMSNSHKARNDSMSNEMKAILLKANKDRPLTPEHRNKLSESCKKKPPVSEETRRKLSEAATKQWARFKENN